MSIKERADYAAAVALVESHGMDVVPRDYYRQLLVVLDAVKAFRNSDGDYDRWTEMERVRFGQLVWELDILEEVK